MGSQISEHSEAHGSTVHTNVLCVVRLSVWQAILKVTPRLYRLHRRVSSGNKQSFGGRVHYQRAVPDSRRNLLVCFHVHSN